MNDEGKTFGGAEMKNINWDGDDDDDHGGDDGDDESDDSW